MVVTNQTYKFIADHQVKKMKNIVENAAPNCKSAEELEEQLKERFKYACPKLTLHVKVEAAEEEGSCTVEVSGTPIK